MGLYSISSCGVTYRLSLSFMLRSTVTTPMSEPTGGAQRRGAAARAARDTAAPVTHRATPSDTNPTPPRAPTAAGRSPTHRPPPRRRRRRRRSPLNWPAPAVRWPEHKLARGARLSGPKSSYRYQPSAAWRGSAEVGVGAEGRGGRLANRSRP